MRSLPRTKVPIPISCDIVPRGVFSAATDKKLMPASCLVSPSQLALRLIGTGKELAHLNPVLFAAVSGGRACAFGFYFPALTQRIRTQSALLPGPRGLKICFLQVTLRQKLLRCGKNCCACHRLINCW
jgi:hypothetical protein